ncbi:MAG: carboxypeptidase-like regulatory domain-containing protein, partial [Prolixibacteraceae bacterium]|nr:carboxypeptidase-like regulatory domain-containing protein [Prolixibacteraceae bacterium]
MKIKILISALLIGLFFNSAYAQYRVAGFVKDGQTGEKLIGANVIEPGTNNGVSTNSYGYFSLITKNGNIRVSFIGYKTVALNFSRDTLVHVQLEAGEIIEEVVVKGELSKRFNITTLSQQEMFNIPTLGGKPDVMKALQLMPGIQAQQ